MFFQFDLAIMGFGLVALMLYRYHVLNGSTELMNKKWFIPCLFFASNIYLTPVLVTFKFACDGMTIDIIVEYINRTAPHYIKVVNTGICSGFVNREWAIIYFATAFIQVVLVCFLAIYYSIKSVILLHYLKDSMSATTYALQKQFIYSVIIQIMVPLFSFVLPVLFILIVIGSGCQVSLSELHS